MTDNTIPKEVNKINDQFNNIEKDLWNLLQGEKFLHFGSDNHI